MRSVRRIWDEIRRRQREQTIGIGSPVEKSGRRTLTDNRFWTSDVYGDIASVDVVPRVSCSHRRRCSVFPRRKALVKLWKAVAPHRTSERHSVETIPQCLLDTSEVSASTLTNGGADINEQVVLVYKVTTAVREEACSSQHAQSKRHDCASAAIKILFDTAAAVVKASRPRV